MARARTPILACLLVALLAPLGAYAASELPPAKCVMLLRRARAAGMNGDVDEQLRLLRRARRKFPDELSPVLALVEYGKALGLPESEVAALRRTLRTRLRDLKNPVPRSVLEYLATSPSTETAELEALAAALEERLHQAGLEREILLTRAKVAERLGDREGMYAALAQAFELKPSRGLRQRLIHLSLARKEWERALELLKSLLEVSDPGRWLVETHLMLLARLGRMSQLQREVNRLQERSEGGQEFDAMIVAVLDEAAWTMRDARRDAMAERLWRQAMRIAPDYVPAQRGLYYFYATPAERAAGPPSAFVPEIGLERAGSEPNPILLLDEAVTHLASGAWEAGYEILVKVAPELEDSEAAWFNLGIAAFNLERWADAARAFAHALELNPERLDSHFQRGVALFYLERCAEAVEPLEFAVTADKSYWQSWYYLAECKETLGDSAGAAAALRRYRAAVEAHP